MTDEEFDKWNASNREAIACYLERQGIASPNVGEGPAFEMAPNFGIWCIESQKQPGKIGWWAFAGDCPIDYVSENGDCHPRSALRDLVSNWETYATYMKDGHQPPDTTIGAAGQDIQGLGELLEGRVAVLRVWLAEDDLWQDR